MESTIGKDFSLGVPKMVLNLIPAEKFNEVMLSKVKYIEYYGWTNATG